MATDYLTEWSPQFLARCRVGSRLYGIHRTDSDHDLVQITARPQAMPDTKPKWMAWTLDHYLECVAKGHTIMFDVLWQDPAGFLFITPEFEAVLIDRESLSNRALFRKEARWFAQRCLCNAAGKTPEECTCENKRGRHQLRKPIKGATQLARLAVAAAEFLRPGPYPANFDRHFPNEAAQICELRDRDDLDGLIAFARPWLAKWCEL